MKTMLLTTAAMIVAALAESNAQTWKAISAGSSSGIITYQCGTTSTGYTPAQIGGWSGADAKCVAEFGSGWVAARKKHRNYSFTTATNAVVRNNWVGTWSYVWGTASDNANCNNWTSSSSGEYGYYFYSMPRINTNNNGFDFTSGGGSQTTCDTTSQYPLSCCNF